MTRKMALVDIDGCLVINSKLNMALVEHLKQFDEVVLFTQRSMFLQIGQITRPYILADTPPQKDDLVTTTEAVNALSKILKKPVKVSTSVDPFFGLPTEYFAKQLSEFERQLQQEMIEYGADYQSQPYLDKVDTEMRKIKSKSDQFNNPQATPDTFYPQKKVDQFNHFVMYLSSDDYQITYFDDNYENIQEIHDSQRDRSVVSLQCFKVEGSHVVSRENHVRAFAKTASFHSDMGEIKSEGNVSEQNAKLVSYLLQFREDCSAQSPKMAAKLFSGSHKQYIADQRSAALKIINQMEGEMTTPFTPGETRALSKGKLHELTADYLADNDLGQQMRPQSFTS